MKIWTSTSTKNENNIIKVDEDYDMIYLKTHATFTFCRWILLIFEKIRSPNIARAKWRSDKTSNCPLRIQYPGCRNRYILFFSFFNKILIVLSIFCQRWCNFHVSLAFVNVWNLRIRGIVIETSGEIPAEPSTPDSQVFGL